MWGEKRLVPASSSGGGIFGFFRGLTVGSNADAGFGAACAVLAVLGGLGAWTLTALGKQVHAHDEIASGTLLVAGIDRMKDEHLKAFDHIAEFMERRSKLVYGQLHPLGAETRKLLAAINEGAHGAQDHQSADYALRAQENFLLARLYAAKFLDTNDAEEAERVNKEFEELYRSLKTLDASLENPEPRELLAAAAINLPRYKQTFDQLVEIVHNRNGLRDEVRGKTGAEKGQTASEVKASAPAGEAAPETEVTGELLSSI